MPPSGNQDTARDSSTYRGTLDNWCVGALCPTIYRDHNSPSELAAIARTPLVGLLLNVPWPDRLLPSVPPLLLVAPLVELPLLVLWPDPPFLSVPPL